MTNQKLKETIVAQAVEIADLKESLRLEEFLYKVRTEEVEKLKKDIEEMEETLAETEETRMELWNRVVGFKPEIAAQWLTDKEAQNG